MATVLVTGGTGTLGRHLVPVLAADGYSVRVLSRKPGEGHVVGDLADGRGVDAAVDAAVDGVDVVVHAATSPRDKDADVRATEALCRAAKQAASGRFPGKVSTAFARGAQVSGPGAEHGTTTWPDWLAARG